MADEPRKPEIVFYGLSTRYSSEPYRHATIAGPC